MKDEYSPYKVVHHYDKIEAMRRGEQPTPMQVHLVPTNRCNHSCTFCAYRLPDYSSGQNFHDQDSMPYEKLMETLYACNKLGIKAIQYTGGGEPLVHPNIKEAFVLTKKLGMEIALVTNGMALDEELIALLTDVAWVRVSVDAFSKDTYSLIRRVKSSCYDKVIKNIGELAKLKKGTTLGVGFVVNAENYREIYDACKLARDLGVDNFRISAAFTPIGVKYFDAFYDVARDLAAKAKTELESPSFTVFNLFNDRIGDLFTGVQNYEFCPIKELVPYIAADMNVYTCCVLAYNENGFIGSLVEQDFYDLWHSDAKKIFYENHSPQHLCQIPCMFKNKNEFINYCINKTAKHTYFI